MIKAMISHLSGTLIEKSPGTAIIDVSGVGYTIYLSSDTWSRLPKSGSEVSLWTHLAVRENSMDLYGFSNKEDLTMFELLIDVPGIGPKSALAVLSLASVETLTKSISSGDTTYLTRVSGIGKKSAEKIILELRDKLGSDEDGTGLKEEADVVEALTSLGYTLRESRDILKNVPGDITGTSERVRAALKLLGK